MKKALAILALSAAATGVQAQQAFVELGLGQAMYDVDGAPGVSVDDKDTTFAISGGWMFTPNIGAEVGYRDLGGISASGGGASASADVDGFMLGVVGRINVAQNIAIVPRAGLYMWDASGGGLASGAGEDGTDFYFGVGAEYSFTKQFFAGAHWARFDLDGSDVDVIELKVGFRF
jgi:OmpA-OmpF porin, OOP family